MRLRAIRLSESLYPIGRHIANQKPTEAKAFPQIYPPNLWVKQELKGLCDDRLRAARKLSIRFRFRLSQRLSRRP